MRSIIVAALLLSGCQAAVQAPTHTDLTMGQLVPEGKQYYYTEPWQNSTESQIRADIHSFLHACKDDSETCSTHAAAAQLALSSMCEVGQKTACREEN